MTQQQPKTEDGSLEVISTPTEHVEVDGSEKMHVDAENNHPVLTEEERELDRKILWKIDLLILPLCALNYFFSSMDKVDIGNAKVAGFATDNHLSATQFSAVVSMFYVGYIVFQPFAGVLILWVEPWLLLGLANMTWGLFTVLTIFSTNMVLPSILRVFIGVAEALANINNIFLTMWYTKEEIGLRTGIWYSSGVLAGGFNGLIAWGIQNNIQSKYKPWQLLFLIEGLLPIAFGPILMYFYPSRPEKVKKYFTEEEKRLCITRSRRANNSIGHKVAVRDTLVTFRSPEVYGMWLSYFCVIWAASGYGNFLPSIINGLGYDAVKSQLLTVPISFLGFLSVNFWCYFSDKFQLRGPLIMGLASGAIAGFAVLAGVAHAQAPRIFALCLINFSIQPLIPLTLAFFFVNTAGLSRRAVALPLQNAVAQLGGLSVNYTFVDSPRYLKGTIATLCCLGALLCIVAALDVYFVTQNRKKAAAAGTAQFEADRRKTLDELGGAHPDFTYSI